MIRVAGYTDYSHMSRIHSASFERGWKAAEIKDLMEKPGTKGFVYDVEDSRQGLAIIRMVEDECEIITIAVAATSQRKGIGGKLLDHIKKYAKRENIKTLFLEVAEDNLSAIALYEKAGFTRFGVRKGYYRRWHGRAVDAIQMRFTIA